MDLKELAADTEQPVRRRSALRLRLRNYFLTGIVVAAPISITIYLTWSIIQWIDGWVKPLIPDTYNPDNYLPFSLPGVGLLVAILALTLLGFLTANLVGRTLVGYSELMLDRMPLVRNLYRGLKQIFQTVLSESSRSFKQVGLIEYPRRGAWSIVFIATEAKGEVKTKLDRPNDATVCVFVPTTPNPTSGYLLFVPKSDLIVLDMSVEEAAKLVISGGLVAPEHKPAHWKRRKPARRPQAEPPPAVAAE
jgi:uncharacterized membrane protein